MNRKSSYNGSIIIMILIIMTALIALIHVSLQTSSYLVLLSKEREKQANSLKSLIFNSFFLRYTENTDKKAKNY